MIHQKTNHFTKKAVLALKEVVTRAVWDESTSIRRRMGANGMANPSMYKTWKWHKFSRIDKQTISDLSPKGIIPKTFLFFFRKYDAGVGLLDKMTRWVDTKNTISFLCVSLESNQSIIIDGKLYLLQSGDSIKFNITHEHEVPRVKEDALWAIWMLAE